MRREDGSIASVATSTRTYGPQDHGIHLAVVVAIKYTDDDANVSAGINGTAREVLYDVLIVGGPKSGQICYSARMVKPFSGAFNYFEANLKPAVALLRQPLSSTFTFEDINELNGDFVYVQFVGGNTQQPVIVGLAKQPTNKIAEATESEGNQLKYRFNGITTHIDADGVFKWSKDNGIYTPIGFNVDEQMVVTDDFMPFPGIGKDAVTIEISNEYNFKFAYNTGLLLEIDGLTDSYAFGTKAGAAYNISGLTDSHEWATLTGTTFSVTGGASDEFSMASAAGATLTLSGISDEFSVSLTSGTAFTVGPAEASLELSVGTKLTMSATEASLLDATGAGFKVSNGMIAMGNASAELVDLISQAFQALSTQTAAGFGAPTSTVATFAQLMAQIALIKGTL